MSAVNSMDRKDGLLFHGRRFHGFEGDFPKEIFLSP